jgi:Ser/Thr protein kinase RdoA (MazF antagonist)
MNMLESILAAYSLRHKECQIVSLNDGLINKTWKISSGSKSYILQRINNSVFKNPHAIAQNIKLVDEYLKLHHPHYLFVAPLKTESNDDMVVDQRFGYFRLFPFIEKSHTVNVVTTPDQAYEAALQFGRFTHLLSGFDASQLTPTIPDFHNLSLRYSQFEQSMLQGNPKRIVQSKQAIARVHQYHHVVLKYQKIIKSTAVKHRVTHHDTKISNVLFNDEGKGMCVIDLDTVMPGYFISDVGDMMRTYLSPVSEEEKDLSAIAVREEYFTAIVKGYLQNMRDDIASDERDLIFYSGPFMIYMQAIRFLADHLNNDQYYGAKYEDHNLTRAWNQLVLLDRLMDQESNFNSLIAHEFRSPVLATESL